MNSQIGQHENVHNIIDENEINFKNNYDEQNMPTHQDDKQEVHIENIEKIEKIDNIKIFIDHLIQNKEKVMVLCLILGLCGLIVKIII
jgi:hypothetical protein